MTLFLMPFNLAFYFEAKGLMGKVFIGIFDFILIGVWYFSFYLLVKFLKYGVSSLEFEQFPYFLGEELHVRLKVDKHGDLLQNVKINLRCIQEAYETRRSANGKTQSMVVCYQIYEDVLEIANSNQLQSQLYLPIQFKIPVDQIYASDIKVFHILRVRLPLGRLGVT